MKLLTTEDIAQMVQMAPRTVRDKLVKQPSFPAPVVPLRGRAKRWVADEVSNWLQRKRA